MRLVALGTPVRGAEAGGVVSWQGSVKDKDLTAPPGSPSTGDRYIVASVATGAWTGQEDDIAEWTGSAWSFDTPEGGWAVWVDDENEIYVFDGSSWNQESLGPHAATHEDGGSDEVAVENLPTAGGAGAVVTGDGAGGLVMAMPGTPGSHKATHENGGIDEVSVAALSGLLADPQTPLAHLLVSAFHTASGLTPGDVLAAITATTFGFVTPSLGALEKAIDHTWEGNNANSRSIDLGDDYQLVLLFLEESISSATSQLLLAWAFKNAYGLIYQSASNWAFGLSMAQVNAFWQGKSGNNVVTGTAGSSSKGTNYTGWTYRLVGFKFASME